MIFATTVRTRYNVQAKTQLELKNVTDPYFIEWLSLYVSGEDFNLEGEPRGYKSKYEKYLVDFKPTHTQSVYRGLHPDDLSEDWFLELLEIKESPKVGDVVMHSLKRPTAWTTDINMAKAFASPTGCVLSLAATPKNTLMDVNKVRKHLCEKPIDKRWEQFCDYETAEEKEITILPGRYKAKVVAIIEREKNV